MRDRCFIVGSGPSLCGFDYGVLQKEDTITINQSIFSVPNPTYFVTKDYTWVRKQKSFDWPSWRVAETFFVVGMRGERLRVVSEKQCVDTKFQLTYKLSIFDNVIYTKSDGGIGFSWDDFRNGGDSGYAALQLAVLLGYKQIYLLGIDMMVAGDRTHCHEDYTRRQPQVYMEKLRSFGRKYERAFGDVNRRGANSIVSCSPISSLNEFIPYIPIKEALCSE